MSKHDDVVPGAAKAPRNQWYVIAFSREITRQPFKREIMGEPVVLYRTEAGDPIALFDRCPHRGMPLSCGKLLGDRIQCSYHGFEYATDGRCEHVPTNDVVPRGMRVHAYPLVERWQWIWIWMGDPRKVDLALIPDHEDIGVTMPGFFADPGIVINVDANYLLVLENLSDATHFPYLHGALPFSGDTLDVTPRRVSKTTQFKDEQYPAAMEALLGLKFDRVNRSLRLAVYPPQVEVTTTTIEDLSDPQRRVYDNRWVMGITPASRTRTYVFAGFTQNYPIQERGWWDGFLALTNGDWLPLADVQRLFDSLPRHQTPEVSVKEDRGALIARGMIARMLAADYDESSAAVVDRA